MDIRTVSVESGVFGCAGLGIVRLFQHHGPLAGISGAASTVVFGTSGFAERKWPCCVTKPVTLSTFRKPHGFRISDMCADGGAVVDKIRDR